MKQAGERERTTSIAMADGLGLVIGRISGRIGIGGGVFLTPALFFLHCMLQRSVQGMLVATWVLPIGISAF